MSFIVHPASGKISDNFMSWRDSLRFSIYQRKSE